jgi:hypothetical protein
LSLVFLLFTEESLAGCNIFRVNIDHNNATKILPTEKTGDQSNCVFSGSTEGGDLGEASTAEPTEEDNQAWVDFINEACTGYYTSYQTFETLDEIQSRNVLFSCKNIAYTSLPPPAPTYLTGEISFNAGLISTSGLDELVTASSLYFDGTQVTNLDGLYNLQSVGKLSANHTKLTNILGLSNLISINYLNLYNTPLVSLDGIQGLTTIGELTVDSDLLTDFTGLNNVTHADRLNFQGNKGLLSFSGLEDLTSLGLMQFRGSRLLDDVTGLSNLQTGHIMFIDMFYSNEPLMTYRMSEASAFCTSARRGDITFTFSGSYTSGSYARLCGDEVNLSSGWVKFINQDCVSSQSLLIDSAADLSDTNALCSQRGVTNMPAENAPTTLKSLNMYGNNISQISGMSNVTSVTGNLTLAANKLVDFQGLGSLNNISTLDAGWMPSLTSVRGLESLRTTDKLDFIYGNITDLTELSSLTYAGYLGLGYNNLATLYGLESLTSAGSLIFSNNPLVDITGVGSLSSATTVDFQNSLSNLSVPLDDSSAFCVAVRDGSIVTLLLTAPLDVDDVCVVGYLAAVEQGRLDEIERLAEEEANNVLRIEWVSFISEHCNVTSGYRAAASNYNFNNGGIIDCSNRGITNDMMPDRWYSADDDFIINDVEIRLFGNNLTHTNNFRGMYFIGALDLSNNNITDTSGLITIGYALDWIDLKSNPIVNKVLLRANDGVVMNTVGDETSSTTSPAPYNIGGRLTMHSTPYCNTEVNWYKGECNFLSVNPAIP